MGAKLPENLSVAIPQRSDSVENMNGGGRNEENAENNVVLSKASTLPAGGRKALAPKPIPSPRD